jgi:putative transposase
MPRAKVILQNDFPYNISARCINKEWFSIPMPEVWNIFSEELYMTNMLYDLLIHSFVLMNNHFHLIASTPNSNISQCMHYFMKQTSLRLTRAGNRINETYTGRHFKTILHSENYFLNAYKYNYQNPLVIPGINRVEDYPYSTLHALLGRSRLTIPVTEDFTLFNSVEITLEWLNKKMSNKNREAIRWALKRQYFKSKLCKNTRRPIITENDVA